MEQTRSPGTGPAGQAHQDKPVLILNGFADHEIMQIMRAVKTLCRPGAQGEAPLLAHAPQDLIFAKTTPNSLGMVLGDLIGDMAADHAWLQANPPKRD